MSLITFGAQSCGGFRLTECSVGETEPETPLLYNCCSLVKSERGLQSAQQVILSP